MCRYHAGNCKQYIGKLVHVQTHDGAYRGIVERVASKGLYLRPVDMASGEKETLFRTLESSGSEINAHHVFYGGYGYGYGSGYGFSGASFFVPFLSILALSSLLFW
jgi:hypothetical protein